MLNRGVGRQQLFFGDDDYLALERIVAETLGKRVMRLFGYCLMSATASSQPYYSKCRLRESRGKPLIR